MDGYRILADAAVRRKTLQSNTAFVSFEPYCCITSRSKHEHGEPFCTVTSL